MGVQVPPRLSAYRVSELTMTVHRFWYGIDPPPYPIVDAYVERSYQTIDWGFENLPFTIQKLATDTAKYVNNDTHRHYANVARLHILWTHGGIYLDHDIIPLTHLDLIPQPFIGSFGGVHGAIWPGIMGFPPEHPMIGAALKRVADVDEEGDALAVSGFHVLRNVFTSDVTLHNLACDSTGLPLPGSPFAFHLGHGRV